MTIAFTGSAVLDVDDIPDANSLPDIQVEEVIWGESSWAGGSSEYNYFVGFHTGWSMGGPGGGRGSGGWIGWYLL